MKTLQMIEAIAIILQMRLLPAIRNPPLMFHKNACIGGYIMKLQSRLISFLKVSTNAPSLALTMLLQTDSTSIMSSLHSGWIVPSPIRLLELEETNIWYRLIDYFYFLSTLCSSVFHLLRTTHFYKFEDKDWMGEIVFNKEKETISINLLKFKLKS